MTNEKPATLTRLVIRVGTGSLSFATTRHDRVVYENYPLNSGISLSANLREALHSSEILGSDYQRVLVMVDSPVLMIPTVLFHEDQAEEFYRHTITPKEQTVVKYAVLPDLNCVAVFAVNKDLTVVLSDRYKDLRYTPVTAPVWHHLHQRSFTGLHGKLYGYFHDHRLEVFSFAESHFKFCNQFVANNPSDALYYLLSAWKEMGLVPERDELYLASELPDGEELVEEARKFVKRVFVINPSGEFNRAAVTQIEGIPYDLVTLFIKGR